MFTSRRMRASAGDASSRMPPWSSMQRSISSMSSWQGRMPPASRARWGYRLSNRFSVRYILLPAARVSRTSSRSPGGSTFPRSASAVSGRTSCAPPTEVPGLSSRRVRASRVVSSPCSISSQSEAGSTARAMSRPAEKLVYVESACRILGYSRVERCFLFTKCPDRRRRSPAAVRGTRRTVPGSTAPIPG